MCRLDKRYKQKDMSLKGGPTRIVENTHQSKEATTTHHYGQTPVYINKSLFIMNQWSEVKTRPIYECRCDERLKTKAEESTCLVYTGLLGELEHLLLLEDRDEVN